MKTFPLRLEHDHSFEVELFDQNDKPVIVTLFVKVIEEDEMRLERLHGTHTFRPTYDFELIRNEYRQDGKLCNPSDDDTDSWDSEIHRAIKKELEAYVNARRSA